MAPAIFIEISKCESGMRQYTDNGNLLISKTHDVGLMQISLIHKKEAESLGYSLESERGNIAYALYLYRKEGVKPWKSSEKCWNKNGSSS